MSGVGPALTGGARRRGLRDLVVPGSVRYVGCPSSTDRLHSYLLWGPMMPIASFSIVGSYRRRSEPCVSMRGSG